MWHRRIVALSGLALVVLLCSALPGVAADEGDIKVRGFAGVPGTSLTLPLPDGAAPVVIDVTFGIPAVTIPIQVTSDTGIKKKGKSPTILLANGDAVKIRASVVGSVLRASRLELLDFPELELIGIVEDLPAAGVALPLAAGTTQDMDVQLGASGVDVPVRLTSKTKLDASSITLHNGDVIRVEAVVRGGVIVVTKLKTGPDEDDDDD